PQRWIKEVLDQDELILITRKGVTCRTAVKGISVIGRNTQGVRLMQLRDDDTVIDVAHVVTDESQ
ncbi:MAG TPA: DNA gyrase C-terminal beta-propeller domain-containing protein, partial [candidate division Zixibacteria bacterium]|nr:DNA gyrase C-terminal beta-propeller domain-containing protein [candidate division Zixibacteria bacterium]